MKPAGSNEYTAALYPPSMIGRTREICDDINHANRGYCARCLNFRCLGATDQVDELFNPADRHVGRFPCFAVQRRGWPAGRVWPTLPDRRRESQPDDSGNTEQFKRHTGFLSREKKSPPRIQYKRVTPRFFAVSSYKGDKVWYDRCNFSGRLIHCVLINYPAAEEHDWDQVVTRISLSLSK